MPQKGHWPHGHLLSIEQIVGLLHWFRTDHQIMWRRRLLPQCDGGRSSANISEMGMTINNHRTASYTTSVSHALSRLVCVTTITYSGEEAILLSRKIKTRATNLQRIAEPSPNSHSTLCSSYRPIHNIWLMKSQVNKSWNSSHTIAMLWLYRNANISFTWQ